MTLLGNHLLSRIYSVDTTQQRVPSQMATYRVTTDAVPDSCHRSGEVSLDDV